MDKAQKIKNYHKIYHAANKDKWRKYSATYRKKNAEKIKAYRSKNKKKAAVYRKKYNKGYYIKNRKPLKKIAPCINCGREQYAFNIKYNACVGTICPCVGIRKAKREENSKNDKS